MPIEPGSFIFTIRQLAPGESLPFDLLLLADATMAAIEKYINQCDVFVLVKENKSIAVFALFRHNKDQVEIKNIAVAETWQGKGLGPLLLKDAIEKATKQGYHEIIVGTTESLCGFYEKAGFCRYGVKKDFYLSNYPDPIIENGEQLIDMIMLKRILQ